MMSRALKLKLSCAALLALLLFFTGLFWYFHVYTKTPEYALHSIKDAFDRHDEALFLRYVRLDTVLDAGYDDFMRGTMDAAFGHSREASAALEDFSKMLKPAFITMIKDAVHTRLTTGEWPSADPADDGADTDNILSRIGVRDLTFRELANPVIHEDTQTAEIDVVAHQGEADSDFTFKVILAPSEEGDWQVVSVQNLHEYAIVLERARRLRVESYLEETDTIMARHDQTSGAAQLRLYSVLGRSAARQHAIWHVRSWSRTSLSTGRNARMNCLPFPCRAACRACTSCASRSVICTLPMHRDMQRG